MVAIIGVDIGGHHIAAALTTDNATGIIDGTYRHRETDRKATKEALLDIWAALLNELIAASKSAVRGVGIAMPGPFDYAAGVGHFEHNDKFEALRGVDVRAELAQRLDTPLPIRFLNDATAFAAGCSRLIKGANDKRIVAVTLGTGLGSAFLDKGIPITDADDDTVPLHGCLWHLPYGEGIADDYVSSRWLLARGKELGSDCNGVAELAELARKDAAFRPMFRDYGANLSAILGSWLPAYRAEMIVMGGRITKAFDLFSVAMREGLEGFAPGIPIAIHEETEDAAILGAAITFDADFWAQVEPRLPKR